MKMCLPQQAEFAKRARIVMDEIKANKFAYSELSMYLLHMEAARTHRRLVFKRPELVEVRARLSNKFPLLHYQDIPNMDIQHLPRGLTDFVHQLDYAKTATKVEWFYGGIYHYEINTEYKRRIKVGRAGDRQIYSKACDTLGFNDSTMAFKAWTESIDRPGVVIKYEGVAFHLEKNTVVSQTMRMVSHILDCEHAITVTVVQ